MDYYIYKASDAASYLPTMGWCIELFFVLYLMPDFRYVGHNYLVGEPMWAPVIPIGTVVKNAEKLGVNKIIMAHTHPNDYVMPSKEDIKCTMYYRRALADYGIKVIDHIIVSGKDWYSLRAQGFFRSRIKPVA